MDFEFGVRYKGPRHSCDSTANFPDNAFNRRRIRVTTISGSKVSRPRNATFWTLWSMVAAFGAYFCMYGFRKPFGAGEYADLKDYLVASQVAGYAISKFIGIRVVSEMPRNRRAFAVLWLILMAEFALILFAIVPPPWNAFCMFLNGLPLGMVFGMIMGLLEGRRLTEALTSALCASFILADGVTKSVGSYLLDPGKVSEAWMPATAGAVFLVPLAVFVAIDRKSVV